MRLIEDVKAFSEGSTRKAIVTILTNPCFHSICLYRLAHLIHRIHLGIIAKVIWYINRLLFHVDIDYRAKLDGGIVIKHGLGLVIGKNVETHGSVTLYQGVTLGGMNTTRDYNGKVIDQPILLDGVVVYADAKIFGPVIIGKNNKIKAGQIITSDMPNRD